MSLVSILVPVYNVEKYVSKCLDSLLAQTYSPIEVILINDGSTDSSQYICKKYADKYANVHLYSYPNEGISATRNRALSHATGEYVMFVDSDDYIHPKMIETMMEVIQKNPEVDLVQCNFRMDYPFGVLYRGYLKNEIFSSQEALKQLAQQNPFNNYPWGKLTRRSCFDGVQFPENIPGFEDTFTIFKSMYQARNCAVISKHFYHYVQRSGSLTNCMSLNMVEFMRLAYSYQKMKLDQLYPQEEYSFDFAQYYTDMVLIYTLLIFTKRKDQPVFITGPINWNKIPLIYKWAYKAWLGLAKLKFGSSLTDPIRQKEKDQRAQEYLLEVERNLEVDDSKGD